MNSSSNKRRNNILSKNTTTKKDNIQLHIALQLQIFNKLKESIIDYIHIQDENNPTNPNKLLLVLTVSEYKANDNKICYLHLLKNKSSYYIKNSIKVDKINEIDIKINQQQQPEEEEAATIEEQAPIDKELNDFIIKSFKIYIKDNKHHEYIPLYPLKECNEFIWWLLEISRCYNNGKIPMITNNIFDINQRNLIASTILQQVHDGKYDLLNSIQKEVLDLHNDGSLNINYTSNTVSDLSQTATKKLVKLPSITNETLIYRLLKQFNLDIDTIDLLEQCLILKLMELENESIQELHMEDVLHEKSQLLTLINQSLISLDEMELWMKYNDTKLTRMRSNIKQIESQNKRLKIQEKNHLILYNTLSNFIDSIKINDYDQSIINNPRLYLEQDDDDDDDLLDEMDIDHQQAINHILNALKNLTLATQAITNQPLLSEMQVVKDQMLLFKQLKHNYSCHITEYMQEIFQICTSIHYNKNTERLITTTATANHLTFSNLNYIHSDNKIYQLILSQHEKILKFHQLVSYMNEMEFIKLRNIYVEQFKIPYATTTFANYFDMLKKQIDMTHIQCNMSSFLNYDIDSDFFKQNRKSKRSTVITRALPGTILISDAFQNALEMITPIILAEHSFLTQFFHVDQDQVTELLHQLYGGFIISQLTILIELGSKIDSFFSLNMLVKTEEIVALYQNKCDFLIAIITSLQATLRMTFNNFIDQQIVWINSIKVTAKSAGILIPFLKFPSFVERMESIATHHGPVRGLAFRSQTADTTYQKIILSLFKYLDLIANSDEKYKYVVYLQNYNFFVAAFDDDDESKYSLKNLANNLFETNGFFKK